MSICERVLLSQMLLKLDKHKEYAKMIGVEDVSRIKGEEECIVKQRGEE